MSDVVGVVEKITARPQGRGQAYSVQVGGEWYGHGFQRPVFQENDSIEFNIAWNGQYKNVDTASVLVHQQQQQGGQQNYQPQQNTGGGQPQQRNQAQNTGYKKSYGGGGKVGGKDKYWEDRAADDKARQLTIEHQSSRNAAIELVGIALQCEAVSLPAKKADKFDALVALVDVLTDKFNCDLHPENKPMSTANVPDGDYVPPHQEGNYQE